MTIRYELQVYPVPGVLPKALTDALPGARGAQIVRSVRGPGADALGRQLAARAKLVPAHDNDWRIYQLLSAGNQQDPTTASPRVTRRTNAVGI